jgi:hypothetical protein
MEYVYLCLAVCPLVTSCCGLENMISVLRRNLMDTRSDVCRLWLHTHSSMPGHLSMILLCWGFMNQWHSNPTSCQSVCPMMTPTLWVTQHMSRVGAVCMRVSVLSCILCTVGRCHYEKCAYSGSHYYILTYFLIIKYASILSFMALWVVTPLGLVARYKCFREHTALIFSTEHVFLLCCVHIG